MTTDPTTPDPTTPDDAAPDDATPDPTGGRPRRPGTTGPRDERGITTAEYAVGTAAGAGLAGLLYAMLTGGFGDQLLNRLFEHVLGLLGVG